jgi:hypothetical protein
VPSGAFSFTTKPAVGVAEAEGEGIGTAVACFFSTRRDEKASSNTAQREKSGDTNSTPIRFDTPSE